MDTDNNFSLFPNCNQIDNPNEISIAECCINHCNNSYNYCNKSCKDDINCKNNCIHMNRNLCRDICSLASSNLRIPDSDFYNCAAQSGCNTTYTFPDLKCVENNTQKIDQCIKNKWLPSKVNPKEYTNFFQNLPFNSKPLISTNNTTKSSEIYHPHNNTLLYILYIIIIIICICSIFFMKKITK